MDAPRFRSPPSIYCFVFRYDEIGRGRGARCVGQAGVRAAIRLGRLRRRFAERIGAVREEQAGQVRLAVPSVTWFGLVWFVLSCLGFV